MSTTRDSLTARVLPFMQLSNGSSSSQTPPPRYQSEITPKKRAETRFSVTGNAIVTGGAGTLGLAA